MEPNTAVIASSQGESPVVTRQCVTERLSRSSFLETPSRRSEYNSTVNGTPFFNPEIGYAGFFKIEVLTADGKVKKPRIFPGIYKKSEIMGIDASRDNSLFLPAFTYSRIITKDEILIAKKDKRSSQKNLMGNSAKEYLDKNDIYRSQKLNESANNRFSPDCDLQWLHLFAFLYFGNNSQVQNNFIVGRRLPNLMMLTLELLVKFMLINNMVSEVTVKVDGYRYNGFPAYDEHIIDELKYTIKFNDIAISIQIPVFGNYDVMGRVTRRVTGALFRVFVEEVLGKPTQAEEAKWQQFHENEMPGNEDGSLDSDIDFSLTDAKIDSSDVSSSDSYLSSLGENSDPNTMSPSRKRSDNCFFDNGAHKRFRTGLEAEESQLDDFLSDLDCSL